MEKEKLILLWKDKRSWKMRIPLAALCALTCTFTFVVFGPCEIYIQNCQEMPFRFSDMFSTIVAAGVIVFLALTGILLLLRGKLFNYALSMLFAVLLMGYLQGNFLNIDYGTLDGKDITWLYYKWPMVRNLLFWLAVIGIVFVLLYLSRKIWTRTIQCVSAMLVMMQLVALFSLLSNEKFKASQAETGERYLSTDHIYELATKNNVVFFLLDRCDRVFIDNLLAQHPEWAENLNGFTSYNDFTGSFSRTYPSIPYLLTGIQEDGKEPFVIYERDYLKMAWEKSTFIPEIHNSNVQIGLYTDMACVVGDISSVDGQIDNIGGEKILVDKKELLEKMLMLSAYRYFPEALKPFFQIYTGDLQEITTTAENNMYKMDDYEFWKAYQENGIKINKKLDGTFRFYHLSGAHTPYNMNEKAEYDSESNRDVQLTGDLNMIFQYMTDMKENGVFDETTIIISTDHSVDYPEWPKVLSKLNSPRILPLLIKPANADLSTPLQKSNKQISQDNLRASIAGYFGLDAEKYGRTIESIGEDETLTRIFWMQLYDETLTNRDANTGVYTITGNGNDFANWHLERMIPLKYPY